MSDRITANDVERVAALVAVSMRHFGMLASDEALIVERGSVTYGRGWKVFVTGGKYGTAWNSTPFGDLWSKDARGLWEKLHVVARTFDAVRNASVNA